MVTRIVPHASGLIAVVLMVSVGAAAGHDLRETGARPAPLTAADYIEIQQLAVRCAYALDTGAEGGEMFARLFSPDGAFISSTRGPIKGHDQLVALGRGREPMYPRRFIVNHVIEPSPEGATGKVYVLEVDLPKDGEKLGGELTSVGGRYEDVYEKTAAGWRFKSRAFMPSRMAVPGAAARPAPGVAPAPPVPGR